MDLPQCIRQNYCDCKDIQQQQAQTNMDSCLENIPYVKIIEQPAGKSIRFRYECEGRSTGSILGVHSSPEKRTYPAIEVVGYKGRAVVVVSCVTKNVPYRPHPHYLVGKEGCKKGVCTIEINSDTMQIAFCNLGIQCVKKKDIQTALKTREEMRVDPFKTGFSHRFQPSSIDLNAVRLCFQVFVEGDQKGCFTQPLTPVVSEPIFDKKAKTDLVICRLSSCSTSVLGNSEIILLCEKVVKEDIAVRFFEEKDGHIIWEAFGEFQHIDVYKQIAISFRTPRYHSLKIVQPAEVFVQLQRPSDGATSAPLPFEYIPLDSRKQNINNLRWNLIREFETDISQRINATNNKNKSEITYEKFEKPLTDMKKDTDYKIATNHVLSKGVQFTNEPEDNKIMKWINSSDFQYLKHLSPEEFVGKEATDSKDEESISMEYTNKEDRTLTDLLEQVGELDEVYSDHTFRQHTFNNVFNKANDANLSSGFGQIANSVNESFDDSATCTSLQIAFKNPVDFPATTIPSRSFLCNSPFRDSLKDKEMAHLANNIKYNLQLPSEPILQNDVSSYVHISTEKEEEKLPPLPPKRHCKQDSNHENCSVQINRERTSRKKNQSASFFMMKTPKSGSGNYNLLSKPKKIPFFSKLFSRKKYKSDLKQIIKVDSSEVRSPKTNHDLGTKEENTVNIISSGNSALKGGKPVGRSVSSVSGKRSTYLSNMTHMPLKGTSTSSLPQNVFSSVSDHFILSNTDNHKTVSALELVNIPLCEGNMELVAITDRQSLRNLCEGEFNILLDPNVDLTEAEHFALYTNKAPQLTTAEANASSNPNFLENRGEILTTEEFAQRLAVADRKH